VSQVPGLGRRPVAAQIRGVDVEATPFEASALNISQWEPIQERIEQIAKDAQAEGSLPSDIDAQTMMLMLISPLLVMALLYRRTIDRKRLKNLVTIIRRMHFSKKDETRRRRKA